MLQSPTLLLKISCGYLRWRQMIIQSTLQGLITDSNLSHSLTSFHQCCHYAAKSQPNKLKENLRTADVQKKKLSLNFASHPPQPAKTKKTGAISHRTSIHPVSDQLLSSLLRRHESYNHKSSTGIHQDISEPALKDMPTGDLIQRLHCLKTEYTLNPEQRNIIENILIKRLYVTPISVMIQACIGFYHQRYNSCYLSAVLSVIDEIFDHLSPTAVDVTFLQFFVFVHGDAPPMLFHKVEEYLLRNLDQFHINDLGIASLGFFCGNSRIVSHNLLDAIASRVLRDLQALEPLLLIDFMKTLRHASFIKVSFYEQLATDIVQTGFLNRYNSINPLMHIAFTYASLQVMHTKLFEHLFSQFENAITETKNVRTKDISKFVWACGTLQFRPEDYEKRFLGLVKYFKSRSKELFPESLAELLVGLVYLEIFSEDLLAECLSFNVASQLINGPSSKEKPFQVFFLNETAKLECLQYKGGTLSKNQIELLSQHKTVAKDLDHEMTTRKGLAITVHTLQESLGTKKVKCHFPLPHFKIAVVELQYCNELGFLSFLDQPAASEMRLPGSHTSYTHKTITDQVYSALTGIPSQLPASKDNASHPPAPVSHPIAKRVAMLLLGFNQCALNSSQVMGHTQVMMRHLRKSGYIVCQLSPDEALQLEASTHSERLEYLSTHLSCSLQTKITLE